MNKLRFIQIQKNNHEHYEAFKDMMIPYNKEFAVSRPDYPVNDSNVLQVIQSCINMQDPHDRHLELVYDGGEPIGFLCGKVDHENHKGHKKPGYGYIMEFYVKPEHRRNGYGSFMFRRLEQHFFNHGAARMYLIYQGKTAAAWLKLNGLQGGKDTAWISMLVVDEKYQRQGVGSYAVRLAEDFVHSKGFKILGIHTTADNIAAHNCYKKLGYHIHKEGKCTTGDGTVRRGISFHRDNLDAVQMNIDGVPFYLDKAHDFSFMSKIGRVFCVFDAMDSGNICFGAERESRRYFIKYAGARTQNYKGKIFDAVTRLRNAVGAYEDLQHPYLIRLIEHYPAGDGYAAVFDWVDGEGLRSYWDYVGKAMWSCSESPNYRFRRLPIKKRIAVVEKIMDFHQHTLARGYIPVDFYDGSMIYDFDTDNFHICDIDFYRKAPAKNDMGIMWGSARFMSPEEHELDAELDEKTVVYLMGAAAFELLSNDSEEAYAAWKNGKLHRSFSAWSATKALFDVALKATSPERGGRYASVAELIEAWNIAKAADNIQYRQLSLSDLSPNMLTHFNRYQVITKSWRNQKREWVLVDNPHIMNWSNATKQKEATEDFVQIINSGGALCGAYDSEKLIGFCGLDGNFIETGKQYLWLVCLHVSYAYRGKGIGRNLFSLIIASAKKLGAKKLYISANSSQESQSAYRAMGCVDAEEIIPKLFESEPYDVHMEYILN